MTFFRNQILFAKKSYDSDAVTFFNRMTVQPNSTRKRLISDFFKGVKSDNGLGTLSQAFDCIWFYAGHNQVETRLNWVKNAHNLTEVNTPTWTLDRGFKGNGSTMYLNTNYNPSTQGINFTQNDASFGIYSRTNEGFVGDTEMGLAILVYPIFLQIRRNTDLMSVGVNSPAPLTVTNTTGLGLFCGTRENSTTIKFWRNGIEISSQASTSQTIDSDNVFTLARSTGAGAVDSYSEREISFGYIGSAVRINQLLLFNRVEEYLDAIGAGVV